jgi:hypothetical protein
MQCHLGCEVNFCTKFRLSTKQDRKGSNVYSVPTISFAGSTSLDMAQSLSACKAMYSEMLQRSIGLRSASQRSVQTSPHNAPAQQRPTSPQPVSISHQQRLAQHQPVQTPQNNAQAQQRPAQQIPVTTPPHQVTTNMNQERPVQQRQGNDGGNNRQERSSNYVLPENWVEPDITMPGWERGYCNLPGFPQMTWRDLYEDKRGYRILLDLSLSHRDNNVRQFATSVVSHFEEKDSQVVLAGAGDSLF